MVPQVMSHVWSKSITASDLNLWRLRWLKVTSPPLLIAGFGGPNSLHISLLKALSKWRGYKWETTYSLSTDAMVPLLRHFWPPSKWPWIVGKSLGSLGFFRRHAMATHPHRQMAQTTPIAMKRAGSMAAMVSLSFWSILKDVTCTSTTATVIFISAKSSCKLSWRAFILRPMAATEKLEIRQPVIEK